RIRQRLDTMPILSADVNNLPDRMLLRASSIISAFAHSYYYIDTEIPPTRPGSRVFVTPPYNPTKWLFIRDFGKIKN
ncbi:MAG: hypothetical protein ACKPDM_10465, partial [Dolichospermum sp.]